MSDAVQLAKVAREHLANALKALQADAQIPDALMEVAEPIAEAMGVLHRIQRTNGENLEGRDGALASVRAAMAKVQAVSDDHPAVDQVLEAIAASLSKVHALARYTPPAAPAPVVVAPVVVAPAAVVPAPVAVAPVPVAIAPAPAPAPHISDIPIPLVRGGTLPIQPAPVAAAPQPVPQPVPQAAPQPQAAQDPAWGYTTQPLQQGGFGQTIPITSGNPAMAAPQASPQAYAAPQGYAQPPVAAPQPAPQPAPYAAQPMPQPAPQPAHQPAPQAAPQPARQASAVVPAANQRAVAGPLIDVELGIHSSSNFYKGLGGNDVIEHGGIFAATYKIPKIGTPVNLRILLPGDYEFTATAVVQWTREGRGGDADPGFGARFTQISPEGRQLVYRYTRNREPMFYDDL